MLSERALSFVARRLPWALTRSGRDRRGREVVTAHLRCRSALLQTGVRLHGRRARGVTEPGSSVTGHAQAAESRTRSEVNRSCDGEVIKL